MIYTNELMLGNKVIHDGKIKTITCIQPHCVLLESWHDGTPKPEEIFPIKLREDFLISLGFELDTKVWWSNSEWFDFSLLDIYPHDGYSLTFDKIVIPREAIVYLHQLQNIYFTITGKQMPTNKLLL